MRQLPVYHLGEPAWGKRGGMTMFINQCPLAIGLSLCLGLIPCDAFSFFASIPVKTVTLAKPANSAKQKRD